MFPVILMIGLIAFVVISIASIKIDPKEEKEVHTYHKDIAKISTGTTMVRYSDILKIEEERKEVERKRIEEEKEKLRQMQLDREARDYQKELQEEIRKHNEEERRKEIVQARIDRRLGKVKKNPKPPVNTIEKMDGFEFEEYCAQILEWNGYAAEVTQKSGDHGVDILAEKDGLKYAVQCKHYKNPVGFDAIKEVYTGMGLYGADRAMVMTNSTFTQQAKEDGSRLKVDMIDGSKLRSMAGLQFYGDYI